MGLENPKPGAIYISTLRFWKCPNVEPSKGRGERGRGPCGSESLWAKGAGLCPNKQSWAFWFLHHVPAHVYTGAVSTSSLLTRKQGAFQSL